MFVQLWQDGKFYAMRDEYCGGTSADGTTTLFLDLRESSIGLTAPAFSKKTHECTDGMPDRIPHPPDAYFELREKLWKLAQSHRWL